MFLHVIKGIINNSCSIYNCRDSYSDNRNTKYITRYFFSIIAYTTSRIYSCISNLNSFIIPLPNFKEQNIVVMYLREKISEYDKILDNIKMQIEKLKEAKQSLISEAVTGKIEILD